MYYMNVVNCCIVLVMLTRSGMGRTRTWINRDVNVDGASQLEGLHLFR